MSHYHDDIQKYLKGELSSSERHALEKKALNDPFLADALEGAEQVSPGYFLNDIAELQQKIIAKKNSAWFWPLRIAAGLALIAVSSYILWQTTNSTKTVEPLALGKKEQESEQPAVTDTLETPSEQTSPTQPPVSKPAVKKSEIASTTPSETEAKPSPLSGEKTEPKSEALIADRVLSAEGKAVEPIATKPTERDVTLTEKAEDAQHAKKLVLADDNRKKRKEAATPQQAPVAGATLVAQTIKGKVTSAEDGSALPGVNIIIKGSTLGTVTDEYGNYEITTLNQNSVLIYSFIGLQSQEVNAGNRHEIDVTMSLDATQLSEVVVTAIGIQREARALGYSVADGTTTLDLAHPVNGYRTYKQYLQQNLRYPEEALTKKIEGRVRVEFTVEADGRLTNFNVLKSIGGGCDNELIRLIQEGPAWVPTKKDNIAIQDKARIELRFRLPK
jgi:TonB family protein